MEIVEISLDLILGTLFFAVNLSFKRHEHTFHAHDHEGNNLNN